MELPEEIRARRMERRLTERRFAQRRRRRRLAGAGVLVAIVVGAVVVLPRLGGDEQAHGRRGAHVPMVADYRGPVPILMYHAIADAPAGTAFPQLFVPPDELEAQVDWLAAQGFHAVTMGQVFDAWEDGTPIARNPIVLSFDDGLRSQYTAAVPILRHRAWPGVLNLKVESLDQGEMTTAMVAEMVAAGWEIGSHTVTHTDVSALSGDSLKAEVAGSKATLEQALGVPIAFFCYPGGRFDSQAVDAVRAAGYRGATTTQPGLADRDENRYLLDRIRIDPGMGVAGLRAQLEAAGADLPRT